MRWSWRALGAAFTVAVLLVPAAPTLGQQPIKLRMGRLAFPGTVTIMADVLKSQGFDRRHGIDLEPRTYGNIAAYYSALATGEIDMLAGGPHVLQKMRNEGVRIQGAFTFVRLATLVVITADPSIQSIMDLRGKTIAADMGSAEYQVLAIYGRSKGLVFGKDVTVVQAGPPLAQAQLAAKRVDAAMTWETNATLTLRDNPAYHIVFSGETAWRSIAKADGWQLLVLANEDFFRRYPQAAGPVLQMFQDGQHFIMDTPDAADRIAQQLDKLPAGVITQAVASKRLVYDIGPAWGAERPVIWEMFKVAVDQGYLSKLPDAGVIYQP